MFFFLILRMRVNRLLERMKTYVKDFRQYDRTLTVSKLSETYGQKCCIFSARVAKKNDSWLLHFKITQLVSI